jgi:hypothetical protein
MLVAPAAGTPAAACWVSGNSEGGDPWEGLSRLGGGESLPPEGRGIA